MIYIDLTIFSIQKIGGISVVWVEYLKRLNKINAGLKYTLLYPDNVNRVASELDLSEYHTLSIKPRGVVSKYFPFFLLGNKEDILHTSYYQWYPLYRGTKIVTLHDFMHEKHASGIFVLLHNILKFLSLNSADVILCISEATKKDFKEIYPKIFLKKDVRVIENAASENFYNEYDGFTYNDEFLWVGGRSGYKNFEYALKILAYLKAKGKIFKITVVGSQLSDKEKVLACEFGVFDQIKVFSDVTDNDLRSMYSKALALLYLSKYEGFGLPIIEAQKCLCPVIALKNPASTEVGKDSILYISGKNDEDILSVLEKVVDQSAREKILKDGLDNAARYDWDESVKKLVAVYKEYQINK